MTSNYNYLFSLFKLANYKIHKIFVGDEAFSKTAAICTCEKVKQTKTINYITYKNKIKNKNNRSQQRITVAPRGAP